MSRVRREAPVAPPSTATPTRPIFLLILGLWLVLPFVVMGNLAQDALPYVVAGRLVGAEPGQIYATEARDLYDLKPAFASTSCELAPAGTDCANLTVAFVSAPPALLFAVGLLASGLASTSVGAYAGAMIMQGLLRKSFPLLVRRLITLIPALVVLAAGVDPSRALVISQVVLSFGIPFALVPLVRLTSNPALMGSDANRRLTAVLGWGIAATITLLNVVLIYLTLTR